jgi:cytochrome c1
MLPVAGGCNSHSTPGQIEAQRGKEWITRMSCGSCHEIPGIEGAKGMVAPPPLRHFGSRQLIAGVLPNTPENLRRYLRSPQTVVPGNEMPRQQLTDRQARAIAAYLLKLR